MTKLQHKIYIGGMIIIGLGVTLKLAHVGYTYYTTPLVERFYHPQHHWFKPSGAYGHGLGIVGTLMILFGVSLYIARKRYGFMSKRLRLKYLLEFHIFLCSLGPVLILFHTAFKFGGIVSVAFWSMVAVVLSGVVGRYIYLQIPRTIEGRELSLSEVVDMKSSMAQSYRDDDSIGKDTLVLIAEHRGGQSSEEERLISVSKYFKDRKAIRELSTQLKKKEMPKKQRRSILTSVRTEFALGRKIVRLQTMQKLFKYWHVVHMPFALVMLVIVIIHVGITLALGYKWVF